jgi:hypothetical protein
MSQKENPKNNPLKSLSPPAIVETLLSLRIRIVRLFAGKEYRLMKPWVSSMATKEFACAQDLACGLNPIFRPKA